MLLILVLAFTAGVLTILSPCTLPIVPLVAGAAATGGRSRGLGIVVGFAGTFLITTILLASALAALGWTTSTLRILSAVILGLVGATLVFHRLDGWLGSRLSPISSVGDRISGFPGRDGLAGGLILGTGVGLIWAPCVGSIMAAVIAVAAVHGPGPETVLIALAYVVGAAVPIALIARIGQRARRPLSRIGRDDRVRRGLGVAMVVTAALVASGLDFTLEDRVTAFLPSGWGAALTSIEQRPDIQEELAMLGADRPTAQPEVALEDLGAAPDFTGIDAWINSTPISMGALRGRVVLVEFWTFGCINCQHVQPYVSAWNDRYSTAGLVVVGVHTPELSFERDLGNVRTAVAKAGITYPVAFDPKFATWGAYSNGYWPAMYFIDRTGRIRHVHIGEGDYDGSEQVIKELLAETG